MAKVELEFEYVHHTPQAVLVSDGEHETWLPLSMVTPDVDVDDMYVGKTYEFSMDESYAESKGLL